MQKILVVGYPKSGNTWLTRLVAELIGCSVGGFFGSPKYYEVAVEGKDRSNKEYTVFKGHQTYSEIKNKINKKNIIYICRDVRSVVVSGANYFFLYAFLKKRVYKILNMRYISKFNFLEKSNIKKMIEVVDKGSYPLRWCRLPWDKHIEQYLNKGILIIRYEDLLSQPKKECKKILNRLGIKRSDFQIDQAINNQSFETVKRKFKKMKDKQKLKSLRSGNVKEYERKLNKNQKAFLEKRFSKTLRKLGYHV